MYCIIVEGYLWKNINILKKILKILFLSCKREKLCNIVLCLEEIYYFFICFLK